MYKISFASDIWCIFCVILAIVAINDRWLVIRGKKAIGSKNSCHYHVKYKKWSLGSKVFFNIIHLELIVCMLVLNISYGGICNMHWPVEMQNNNILDVVANIFFACLLVLVYFIVSLFRMMICVYPIDVGNWFMS